MAAFCAFAGLAGAVLSQRVEAVRGPFAAAPFDGTLSVLTYNIRGLPWPIARDRSSDLQSIADRLVELRERNEAPQLVLLQEAFTRKAQAIGRAAGYRFIADGPTSRDQNEAAMSPSDRSFAALARWWKGETEGKYVGSGLQILSDYPILRVRRTVFPAFDCAGFDCLANKGALLVRIAPPGAAFPVDILTTHLNSRRASGVPDDRSIYAYVQQVALLTDFIRREHDPQYPLIVAGDFNVGSAPGRREALLGQVRSQWVPGSTVQDALGEFRRQGGVLGSDGEVALARARDWQFYASGSAAGLVLDGISIPFGHEPGGAMLSDHIGYIGRYRLLEGAAALGSPAIGSFGLGKA